MRRLMVAVVLLGVAVPGPTGNDDPWISDEAVADIDGDGMTEQIRLERLERKRNAFTIHVDGATITDRLVSEWPIGGLKIVDIYIGDGIREIAVYSEGGGEDPVTSYFWYNGTELHRTGMVGGAFAEGRYGTVLARVWEGFWLRELEYRLGSGHRLSLVEKDFYIVGIRVKVRHDHPIYRTRALNSAAGQMQRGTAVMIIASDCKGDWSDWKYLVKLPDDTTGWLSMDQAQANLSLPLAD